MRRPPGSARLRGPNGVRGALWRSLAVFRLVATCYAVVTVGRDLGQGTSAVPGLLWFVAVTLWSLVMSLFAPAADRRWPRLRDYLVAADVVVCVAVLLAAGAVSPAGSRDVLPALWTASGVFSAALVGGTVGGVAGGVVLAVASFVATGSVSQASIRPAVLFVVSGAVVGYLSQTAFRAESALARLLAARAGDAERERLARDVHDGVLQVLSLIAREAERGLPAADVARLAADQETALRDLLRSPGAAVRVDPEDPEGPEGAGRRAVRAVLAGLAGLPGGRGGSSRPDPAEADLGGLLMAITRRQPAMAAGAGGDLPLQVTVSTPGVPVPLPRRHADEIVAAVRAVLDNVAMHAGPGASAWILLEDDGGSVVVTVRDDGIGIEPGRAEQAAAQGRLGLAVSVRGRIRELGGDVAVTGRPGEGTEVELRVPR
ncbi:Signal transduction histidine kinase [Parafrankia irregularis]|uniref:Signal transduction histidine kinase n=1 Tax=Parafrankia irregularis TaxID=795642 RepID=A0A0S4R108_9ACTN|nr:MULTISPECIES: DUF5931 domain-containing protein [Parafrankia]CUU60550.1 Signal transduction histidine kinase [Parafrankia irregularis]